MNIVSELDSFLPLSLSCSTHQWRTDIWLMLSQTGRPSSLRGSRKLWKQKEYVVIKYKLIKSRSSESGFKC